MYPKQGPSGWYRDSKAKYTDTIGARHSLANKRARKIMHSKGVAIARRIPGQSTRRVTSMFQRKRNFKMAEAGG